MEVPERYQGTLFFQTRTEEKHALRLFSSKLATTILALRTANCLIGLIGPTALCPVEVKESELGHGR